jgi:hypothetical protein
MRDVLRKLDAWKTSKRWTDDGGSYVPNISNFLDRKRSYLHGAPSQNGVNSVRKLDEDEREAICRIMGENYG